MKSDNVTNSNNTERMTLEGETKEALNRNTSIQFLLIPILYEDAQNKTLEIPCLARELFYAGSHRFGISTTLRVLTILLAAASAYYGLIRF
ncbi:MAG: hypothetical protein RM347_022690 [Nostoc sp. ChiQUE02]|uniref:hypothetical protein n=1 Tax=Nostoc sp. ChiQUE02 TaxID=3075377 RepID=UPI002AD338D1|nr:hypothetical protein [Nostoc sp. ChiQUE02]MDZ8233134.1 hypothetical protein [Nostoc sp. ChiQUE02]